MALKDIEISELTLPTKKELEYVIHHMYPFRKTYKISANDVAYITGYNSYLSTILTREASYNDAIECIKGEKGKNDLVNTQLSLIFYLNSGIRPVFYSSEKLPSEFTLGEYISGIASKQLTERLEDKFQKGELKQTDKVYTLNGYDATHRENNEEEYISSIKGSFIPKNYNEYIYDGQKYARIKANFYVYKDGNNTLSNGVTYRESDYAWVVVEPLEWLYFKKLQMAITKNIILSGLIVDHNNYNDFKDTILYDYMQRYLLGNITYIGVEQEKTDIKTQVDSIARMYEERRKASISKIEGGYNELKALNNNRGITRAMIDEEALFIMVDNHYEIREEFIHQLRYLNLSYIDFNNVKVSNVDFSYTNARINPQTVYKKDMSNGNFNGMDFNMMDFTGVNVTNASFEYCIMDFTKGLESFTDSSKLSK